MAKMKVISKRQYDHNRSAQTKRMARTAEKREADYQAMKDRILDDRWAEWTPEEAYRGVLKNCGSAPPDYVELLLPFIQECKRMYPGETFGQLKDRIAHDYSSVYAF